jgi:hypothetical protein
VCQGGAGRCDARLESAMLYYLRAFKKSFITETRAAGMGSSPLMDMAGAPVSKEKVCVWGGGEVGALCMYTAVCPCACVCVCVCLFVSSERGKGEYCLTL